MSALITNTIANRSGTKGNNALNTVSTNEVCVAPDVFVVFTVFPFEMAFEMAFELAFEMAFGLALCSHLNGQYLWFWSLLSRGYLFQRNR